MGLFSAVAALAKPVLSVASKALPFLKTNSPSIISAGGNVIGGMLGSSGAKDINAQNIELSAENRAWQEYMSSTAHQREVEDLRKAGLNPILSAKYGGATTPPGNVAQLNNPYEPLSSGIHSAVSSNLQAQLNKEQLLTQRSLQSANNAQAIASKATAIKQLIESKRVEADIPRVVSQAKKESAGQWYRDSWIYKNIWKPLGDTFETINPFKFNFKGGE